MRSWLWTLGPSVFADASKARRLATSQVILSVYFFRYKELSARDEQVASSWSTCFTCKCQQSNSPFHLPYILYHFCRVNLVFDQDFLHSYDWLHTWVWRHTNLATYTIQRFTLRRTVLGYMFMGWYAPGLCDPAFGVASLWVLFHFKISCIINLKNVQKLGNSDTKWAGWRKRGKSKGINYCIR